MHHIVKLVPVWFFILRVYLPAEARAQSTHEEMTARSHFRAGVTYFHLGNYPAALREFSAGHAATPKLRFLICIGQTYHKLGQLEDARSAWRQFLDKAPPQDKDRMDVERMLREIEQEIGQKSASAGAERPVPAVEQRSGGDASPEPVVAAPPRTTVPKVRAWQRDPAGGVVLGLGLASLAAGAVVLGVGLNAQANAGESYRDFVMAREASAHVAAGGVLAGVGGALLVGAVVRFAVVKGRARHELRVALGR
jgi:tetratricopeptide (TPR) repeat protein